MVKILIKAGANLDARDCYDRTPLNKCFKEFLYKDIEEQEIIQLKKELYPEHTYRTLTTSLLEIAKDLVSFSPSF